MVVSSIGKTKTKLDRNTGKMTTTATDTSGLFEEKKKQPYDGVAGQPNMSQNTEVVPSATQQNNQANSVASPGMQAASQSNTGQQTHFDQLNAATENEIQDEQQNFLQEVQYGGVTGYDRPIEDLTRNKDRALVNIENQVENMRTNIKNQIQDVSIQADRTIGSAEMMGALQGTNRSSGFVQGIANVEKDANRAMDRAMQYLNEFERVSDDEKGNVLADFDRGLTRIKEDFDYMFRDLKTNTLVDLNRLIQNYNLSPEKLGNELDKIALDVEERKASLINTYLNNYKTIEDSLYTQSQRKREEAMFAEQEEKKFATSLVDQGTSFKEINMLVEAGRMTPRMAAVAQNEIATRAVNAIQSYADVSGFGDGFAEQFRGTIIEGLTNGKSVPQVLQEIASSEEYLNSIPETPVDYGFSNLGGGIMARTNPQTGEVEFLNSPVSAMDQAKLREQNLNNDLLQTELEGEQGFNEYNTGYVEGIGTGVVTMYGTEANPFGLDVDGKINDPVKSPVNGTVIEIGNDPKGYGNYAIVEDLQGNKVRYAHLNTIDVEQGMSVGAGMQFATVGRTGNVVPMNGQDGSHVDITLRDPNGNKKQAHEVEQYLNSGGNTSSGGDLIDPVTGVDFDFATRITSIIPATLRNSELEQKNLNARITELAKTGMSPRDAALRYMGFNIEKEEDKDFADNLINAVRSLPEDVDTTFMPSIADLVNQGNYEGATKKMENSILSYAKKQEGDGFVSEATVKTAIERAEDLTTFMNGFESSPGGIVEGTVKKRLGKLKGRNAAKMEGDVTQMIAKLRSDLIGANATKYEGTMLEPLIPSLNDSPAIFMDKLNRLRTQPLLEHNNIRTSYGLPQVDESVLISNNKSSMYRQQTEQGEDYYGELDEVVQGNKPTPSEIQSNF